MSPSDRLSAARAQLRAARKLVHHHRASARTHEALATEWAETERGIEARIASLVATIYDEARQRMPRVTRDF